MFFYKYPLQKKQQFSKMQGFSLVELLLAIGIVGILTAIAIPAYQDHIEKAKVTQAVNDIGGMQAKLQHYFDEERSYPETLAEINEANRLDPWGYAYRYVNLTTIKGKGDARKDKNLNPLNSDFDLYSVGKNNASKTQISNKESLDDVIRANDGAFINLASEY